MPSSAVPGSEHSAGPSLRGDPAAPRRVPWSGSGMMGKVLEQIEDTHRAGKSAFDGDAATRGKFNTPNLGWGAKTAVDDAQKSFE